MSEDYIVIDPDNIRRGYLCELLLGEGYVISLDHIEGLSRLLPEMVWIFVADDVHKLCEVRRYLLRCGKYYPLILYGNQPQGQFLVDLLSSDCAGFLEFPTDRSTFRKNFWSIRANAARVIALRMRGAASLERIRRLTCREAEVAKAICDGLTNKLAARLLSISPRTVELHRASAMARLDAEMTAEMVRICMEAENYEYLFGEQLAEKTQPPAKTGAD